MLCVHVCLALLVSIAPVLASQDTNPALLPPVIELTNKTFAQELNKSKYSGSTCLIEFYAHWCPHCQHYKPIYERIGSFFHQEPRPQPPLWVARVDCAEKKNVPLCDKFGVRGFPTLFLGKAENFLKYEVENLTKAAAKKPAEVVDFINSKLETHYVFEERQVLTEHKDVIEERRETEGHFDMNDVERATVELFERLFQSKVILQSKKVRKAFLKWVELLSVAHPSPRCRRSCRYLKNQIGVLWPEASDQPSPYIARFKMCTIHYKKKEWGSCRGSLPDSRGFTCGLWQLLHSMSVRVKDKETKLWFQGVRAFAEHFFGCAECAKHFLRTLDKADAQKINSRNDLVTWLWSKHNIVNKRLKNEEKESGTGDPAFPKVQWPPTNLCSDCQKDTATGEDIEWKEGKVVRFLKQFYSLAETNDISASRKELLNGDAVIASTEVFSKEDATAIEVRGNRGVDLSPYVFIGMVIVSVLIVRKTRKRKIIPTPKDIL